MREIDKFEKEIRLTLKQRKFDRSEMKGVFKILDMIKDFKRNVPEEITGATEEEINDAIMQLFMPSERDINHKRAGDKNYYNNKTRQRPL